MFIHVSTRCRDRAYKTHNSNIQTEHTPTCMHTELLGEYLPPFSVSLTVSMLLPSLRSSNEHHNYTLSIITLR